jgi:hypothetical protein
VGVSFRQDGEGRLLGPDSRPVRMTAEGVPLGKVGQHSQVMCAECRLPEPTHPYQKELDDAQRLRDEEEARPLPPQAPMPYVPSMAEPFAPVEARLAAMERALASVTQSLADALARLNSLELGAKRRAS